MGLLLDVLGYIVAVALPLGGGALSGLSMDKNDPWYGALNQAPWTPPKATFAIVWPILYFLLGTSSFIVWRHRARQPQLVKGALAVYIVQLFLNLIWSPVFFKAHSMLWALVIIVVLDVAAIFCNLIFAQVSKPAALLFLPYPIWILYATSLSVYIYIKN